jgi:hypothetical protein
MVFLGYAAALAAGGFFVTKDEGDFRRVDAAEPSKIIWLQ